MTEIQGKWIFVPVGARFKLARVRVIRSRLQFISPPSVSVEQGQCIVMGFIVGCFPLKAVCFLFWLTYRCHAVQKFCIVQVVLNGFPTNNHSRYGCLIDLLHNCEKSYKRVQCSISLSHEILCHPMVGERKSPFSQSSFQTVLQ